VLGVSSFVALFLLAFGPFGLSATFPNRTLVIAGYGLVTALCMAFLITVPPFLLPKAFAEERWTVGKEIMMMMLTISLIGVGNTVYTWRVFNYDLSLELFLVFQGVTLLVGSIPASFIVILQYQRYQLLFIRGAREIESRMHAPTTSNTHTTIVSKTMKEGASSNLGSNPSRQLPGSFANVDLHRFVTGDPMESLRIVILILHITAGFGALVLGAVNAVRTKGTRTHRQLGRYYIGCMVVVGASALLLATIRPNLFLAMIGLFSLHMAWGGYRATKIRKAEDLHWSDMFIAGSAFLAGVVLVSMGVMQGNVVMLVFGTGSAMNALSDLNVARRLRAGTLTRGAWMRRHIGLVGGSYIAVWTAFLVVNVPFEPAYIGWLLPTALGTPIIAYATRKHMMRYALLLCLAVTGMQATVDNSLLTAILRQHVKGGVVSYATLKTDARLDRYLKQLRAEDASELTGTELKAFWINVYNAFALKMICDHYPVKSIQDIPNVWTEKFIAIDGETYSLNDVENNRVRPLSDPRTHFALVCAAQSCPPLRSEAYTASKVNAQLDDQGQTFMRSARWNTFDVRTSSCTLSKIVDWYIGDFGGMYSKVLKTLSAFTSEDVTRALKGSGYAFTVSFHEYDWTLNDH